MDGKYIGIGALVVGVTGVLGGGFYACSNVNYSQGSRTGTVVKISERGFPGFKTWEAQLSLGGVTKQGPTVGTNLWDFSINRWMDDHQEKDLVAKLQKAQDEGTPVIIEYDQKYIQLDVRGDTDYFVTNVRSVQPASPEQEKQPAKQPVKQEAKE